MDMQEIMAKVLELGAHKVGLVAVKDIRFDPAFRKMCETNACGNFNRSYMCPPCVGKVEDLIAKAQTYPQALVFQTVDALEDSYDFEGMMEAGLRMNTLSQTVRSIMKQTHGDNILPLGAGGCRLCERCAKITQEPCRHPKDAMASLETYGVAVSELAELAGMRYINGQDTVTYFGAIFFGENA